MAWSKSRIDKSRGRKINATSYRFVDYGSYEPVNVTGRVFVRGRVAPIGNSSVRKEQLGPELGLPATAFDAKANLAAVLSNVRSTDVDLETLAVAASALRRVTQPLELATWSDQLGRDLSAFTD